MTLYEKFSAIIPADQKAAQKAKEYCDGLVKPIGSLGKLEELASRLAGITGKIKNSFERRAVLVFCADNGVVEEGVSSAPASVTLSQTINFAKGMTGVCVLAKRARADVIPIDVGVNGKIDDPHIVNRKIRKGTDNICKGPAMSREEAEAAIAAGFHSVDDAVKQGYSLLGIGEMGIGNTTTASAVLAALTTLPPEQTTGFGAGMTNEGYSNKVGAVKMALSINQPYSRDVTEVLSKVGGLDIAAMTGAYLSAAYHRIPAVMDGFISAVAALCAVRLCPAVRDYIIPSHNSRERGYNVAAKQLDLYPSLMFDMGLGEGSGCPLEFAIIDFACAMMNEMATFSQACIDDGFLDPFRKSAEKA